MFTWGFGFVHDLDLTTDPPPQVTVSLVVSLMQPVAKADHGDQPPLMVTTAGAAQDKVSLHSTTTTNIEGRKSSVGSVGLYVDDFRQLVSRCFSLTVSLSFSLWWRAKVVLPNEDLSPRLNFIPGNRCPLKIENLLTSQSCPLVWGICVLPPKTKWIIHEGNFLRISHKKSISLVKLVFSDCSSLFKLCAS